MERDIVLFHAHVGGTLSCPYMADPPAELSAAELASRLALLEAVMAAIGRAPIRAEELNLLPPARLGPVMNDLSALRRPQRIKEWVCTVRLELAVGPRPRYQQAFQPKRVSDTGQPRALVVAQWRKRGAAAAHSPLVAINRAGFG